LLQQHLLEAERARRAVLGDMGSFRGPDPGLLRRSFLLEVRRDPGTALWPFAWPARAYGSQPQASEPPPAAAPPPRWPSVRLLNEALGVWLGAGIHGEGGGGGDGGGEALLPGLEKRELGVLERVLRRAHR